MCSKHQSMTFKAFLKKEKSKKNKPFLSRFHLLRNLHIQIDFSILTSEKLITVESIPPDYNWTRYDRFALPDRDPGEPVLVFMNLALSQIIDLVRYYANHW